MKNLRKYEYQLSELIDKLSIVTLKSILLEEYKKQVYEEEAKLIMHDINLLLNKYKNKIKDFGLLIRAIQVNMLANRVIWENETKARLGGRNQDHLLPFTHSVNGIRMRAGNIIARLTNERKDLNIDRVNDEISRKHGFNWNLSLF